MACLVTKLKIGDVEVEENLFVQNYKVHLVILEQPYIMASRMETKVFDDGFHYAKICKLQRKEVCLVSHG